MALTARARWGRRAYPWLYVGPAFGVTLILMALPMLQLVQGSSRDWRLGQSLSEAAPVGLDNYRGLLDGTVTLGHSLWLTTVYGFTALGVELALGLGIALLLARRMRGMSILTSIFLVPMVVMPAMVGMIWRLYFSYQGFVNWMLSIPGLDAINWYSPEWALRAVVIADVWQWTPFFVLIFLAGMQALPQDPLEAALVDGASAWQTFRLVKLPLLMPLVLIAAVLRVMELLRSFDVVFAMFAGGPGNATETLPIAVYRSTIGQRNAGLGAAFSLVLIALTALIAWAFLTLVRRWRFQ